MARLINVGSWGKLSTAHIIFIHGLDGHAYKTWSYDSAQEAFWPKWLVEECPGLSVSTLSYFAPTVGWTGTGLPIISYARNIFQILAFDKNIQGGPIIFICHSLGGLIYKQIIRLARDRSEYDSVAESFLDRVRGVVFYSTPHLGSTQATWLDTLRLFFWPSATSLDLIKNNSMLQDLNNWYRDFSYIRNLQHLVIVERQGTAAGVIVPNDTGNPGLLRVNFIELQYDHVKICKPKDKGDERYVYSRDFIENVFRAEIDRAKDSSKKSASLNFHDLPKVLISPSKNILPIIARIFVLLAFLAVGYRGLRDIYKDPFMVEVRSVLVVRNAPQPTYQAAEDIIPLLRDEGITDEYILGIFKGLSLNGKDDSSEEIKVRIRKLADKLANLRAIASTVDTRDTEARQLRAAGLSAFKEGNIQLAELKIQAAQLRSKLMLEAKPILRGATVIFPNGWDVQNITKVYIPQLKHVKMECGGDINDVRFFRYGQQQLLAAFAEIAETRLLSRIRVWCGSYAPRATHFTRVISAHALGIAFDIDPSGNNFGKKLTADQIENFGPIVSILQKYGFLWGGTFSSLDPMHFQLAKIMSQKEIDDIKGSR